jgi:hypothetical protein
MKPGKKLTSIILLSLFGILFSASVNAYSPTNMDQTGRHRHGGGNTVGVPLDGGLLALLAGAGIVYFAARKKRKNQE